MIKYDVVGLVYTRTCPLSCAHCIMSSSPKVQEKMTPQRASEYLKVIPAYSAGVCFTGGEPLLYYNEIIPLIREAKALGLQVSLVTGCGWVRTDKAHIARERIFGLKEAGLDALCVSWDAYHEEFSPAENALLVLDLAKQAGIRQVFVRGVISANGAISRIEDKLVSINIDYQKVPVLRLGIAESLPMDHFRFREELPIGGCGIVLSPVVEPDGRVFACCGPARNTHATNSALAIGNTNDEDLNSIFYRAVRDPLLEAINTIGPYGLYQLVENDPDLHDLLPPRTGYTGMCELCLDITDVPEVVSRIRERLGNDENRIMVLAAKMYRNASPELRMMANTTM